MEVEAFMLSLDVGVTMHLERRALPKGVQSLVHTDGNWMLWAATSEAAEDRRRAATVEACM
ncbi:hypothetical protein BC830DRAFT_1107762, partial [Chytriomyces sp. MP71]